MGEKKFLFELNAPVSITASGESGTVEGRAEYANSESALQAA